MNILFLTSGSKESGLGHIYRISSLFNVAKNRKHLVDLLIDSDLTISKFINAFGGNEYNWSYEKNDLILLIKNYDCVIIDSYKLTKKMSDIISLNVSIPVFIDYLKKNTYLRGIVVNANNDSPNIKVNNLIYLNGKKYLLIRNNFINYGKVKASIINSALIILGGTDVKELTVKIIEVVKPHILNLKVICSEEQINSINKFKYKNVQLYKKINAQKMNELMNNVDIAISGAGQTLNELALNGIPTIMIGIAENQISNINYYEKNGFLYAGWWNDSDLFIKLINNIKILEDNNLRKEISNNVSKLIDGKGPDRVMDIIEEVFNGQKHI